MKGHLMPEIARDFAQAQESVVEQIAKLSPGQWFEVRYGLEQSGRRGLYVVIRPPQIYPLAKKTA